MNNYSRVDAGSQDLVIKSAQYSVAYRKTLSGGVKIYVFKYKGKNMTPFQLDRVGRAGVRMRRTQGTL